MRMEVYALFLDFSQVCQGKHLESAGIGQHRAIPVHKLVKASHFFHDLISGTHVQMIRVAQLHLGADALQIDGRHRTLDSCRCSHIHKYGGLNHAVHRMEFSALGVPVSFQ